MSTSTFRCHSCGKDSSVSGATCEACGAVVPCPRCGWQPAKEDEPARGCFGEYLVGEGLLTATQLLAVLHAQLVRRGRFGEIAVELGYMKEASA